jgi:hypothetical protein
MCLDGLIHTILFCVHFRCSLGFLGRLENTCAVPLRFLPRVAVSFVWMVKVFPTHAVGCSIFCRRRHPFSRARDGALLPSLTTLHCSAAPLLSHPVNPNLTPGPTPPPPRPPPSSFSTTSTSNPRCHVFPFPSLGGWCFIVGAAGADLAAAPPREELGWRRRCWREAAR